jgi:uncharacterized membrane protein
MFFNRGDCLLSWSAMFLAVLAAASLGPVFKYIAQHGVDPVTAASWRCQCMLLFLAPLAYIEHRSDEKYHVDWLARKPTLRYPLFVHIMIGKGVFLFVMEVLSRNKIHSNQVVV